MNEQLGRIKFDTEAGIVGLHSAPDFDFGREILRPERKGAHLI
jgi:hypothetical protein